MAAEAERFLPSVKERGNSLFLDRLFVNNRKTSEIRIGCAGILVLIYSLSPVFFELATHMIYFVR